MPAHTLHTPTKTISHGFPPTPCAPYISDATIPAVLSLLLTGLAAICVCISLLHGQIRFPWWRTVGVACMLIGFNLVGHNLVLSSIQHSFSWLFLLVENQSLQLWRAFGHCLPQSTFTAYIRNHGYGIAHEISLVVRTHAICMLISTKTPTPPPFPLVVSVMASDVGLLGFLLSLATKLPPFKDLLWAVYLCGTMPGYWGPPTMSRLRQLLAWLLSNPLVMSILQSDSQKTSLVIGLLHMAFALPTLLHCSVRLLRPSYNIFKYSLIQFPGPYLLIHIILTLWILALLAGHCSIIIRESDPALDRRPFFDALANDLRVIAPFMHDRLEPFRTNQYDEIGVIRALFMDVAKSVWTSLDLSRQMLVLGPIVVFRVKYYLICRFLPFGGLNGGDDGNGGNGSVDLKNRCHWLVENRNATNDG
ncbi:hypothetical protein MIND_00669600 [Mycena indigotica]|uniref:Uncharacterized protein n=1 Tax=Mycena indigotica TaxID=2126181 RepID=A0A8H6SLK3_9AGAR|nr:uncharacterized protein MIND_00669600 [Mycena indigotica]KAF7301057.1 hypothetical protein MIND_00669600 [Mycena indigotica]